MKIIKKNKRKNQSKIKKRKEKSKEERLHKAFVISSSLAIISQRKPYVTKRPSNHILLTMHIFKFHILHRFHNEIPSVTNDPRR